MSLMEMIFFSFFRRQIASFAYYKKWTGKDRAEAQRDQTVVLY